MSDYYREHLHEALDSNGDVEPPWAAFPDYGRHSMGWRMGAGESWLGYFFAFLEQLPREREVRLGYLRRHPRAPHTWAGWAYRVLDPAGLFQLEEPGNSQEEHDDDWEDDWDLLPDRAHPHLLELGLIASDVAYPTWRARQPQLKWPWEESDSPASVRPTLSRRYWFWSRWARELRAQGALTIFEVPSKWRKAKQILLTGELPRLDPENGDETLVLGLCAGDPLGPWQFGMTLQDAERSGCYASSYTAWVQASFDDRPHLERYLDSVQAPDDWRAWLKNQMSWLLTDRC